MKTTCLTPAGVLLMKAFGDWPDNPVTARREPDQYVDHVLGCTGVAGVTDYIEGLEINYLSLYRESIHQLHPLHPRDYYRVAAAHDLYLAMLALQTVDSRNRSQCWQSWLDLGQDCAKDLAAERGWTFSRASFPMSRLLGQRPRRDGGRHDCDRLTFGFIDHAQFFRHSTKPHRPAAVLTHSYKPAEDIELYAAAFGFECEFLEGSWYYPRKCVAALLTPIKAKALLCR